MFERLGAVGRIFTGGTSRFESLPSRVQTAAEPVKGVIRQVGEKLDSFMLNTQADLGNSRARHEFESNRLQVGHRAMMEFLNRLKEI